MSGELVAVRLLQDHNGKEAGDVVLVDRFRAAKMEEFGIGSIEPPATTVTVEGFVSEAHMLSGEPGTPVTIGAGLYTREEYAEDVESAIKAPRVPPADKMARPEKVKKG